MMNSPYVPDEFAFHPRSDASRNGQPERGIDERKAKEWIIAMQFTGFCKEPAKEQISLGQFAQRKGTSIANKWTEWLPLGDRDDHTRRGVGRLLHTRYQHSIAADAVGCGEEVVSSREATKHFNDRRIGQIARLHKTRSPYG